MQVSNAYSVENIWEVSPVESASRYSRLQEQTTPSGDTVEISNEAKELFSRMIHKYDGAASQCAGDNNDGAAAEGEAGAGGAQGSGGSDSSSTVENIKKQIESLKSQLTALTSQMGGAADAGVMSKINALQSQIAALQAQLNEMQA